MKRRLFLGTATASSTIALQAQIQPSRLISTELPSIRWRMATSWPKTLNIVFGNVDFLCRRVGELTDGQFIITPYAANEIVPSLEVMDAVSAGTAECGHTASYYYINKHPALAFGTTVPFGLNAHQQLAWLLSGEGLNAIQTIYSEFNIINFPAGSTGAQMGGWFKQEIASVDELNGLKMRIPGLGGEVMKRLGVDVQTLAGGEIFVELEKGNIDAAEWVGPYEDERLGLNRVADFYYYPGWWEPGTTYDLQVNLEQWNQLPLEYQKALQIASLECHGLMLAEYDTANGDALQRLRLGGTKLVAFSPEILQAAQRLAFELYEETALQDATFRRIYEQWRDFRTGIYHWNQINELYFNQFVMTAQND
ncbi:MAG: ABC transporter substrate-binding protein [Leptolyngbyaceae bacterium]|nr:ABC transporter substrate-binding protein [Leptolyngbyaceae bacterium]